LISIARHEQKSKFIGATPIDLKEGLAEEEFKCQLSELHESYSEWFKAKHNGDTKYLCKLRGFTSEIAKVGLQSVKKQWTDDQGQRIRMWCITMLFSSLRDGFRALLKNQTYDF